MVIPGLINTHHHMFQTLTRALPGAQDAELFAWLKVLYPVWSRITPAMLETSTQVAMAELLLSGCTTSSDHLYLFPDGRTLDHTIEAAQAIGMRFHTTRGAMSVGESDGGLPPDALVEKEDAILRDTQRVIELWHDPQRYAMTRVAAAPCSPFSVSRDLMRESAKLARSFGAAHGVRLHTHLAENDNDVAYSKEKFGMTPAEYAEDCGWLGDDVWHAHCVKLDDAGIAPIGAMRRAGVPVGLGVDGSASNDGNDMLGEARQAMLLARVAGSGDAGPAAMSARAALHLATRGGARVLRRDDTGMIAPGMAADLALFRLDDIAFAGALHDPVAALLFCAPRRADVTIVNGRVVVKDGQLTTVDLPVLIERHNHLARELVHGV